MGEEEEEEEEEGEKCVRAFIDNSARVASLHLLWYH